MESIQRNNLNKLEVDKAKDNEIEVIRNYMKRMIYLIEEKDKKYIFYLDNEIILVRDVNSDFFLTRVCSGIAKGEEGWHKEVYLIHMNGTIKLDWVYQDAYGPAPYPSDEMLGSLHRQEAALYLYYGNVCAWRDEEKRKITSCSFQSD